MPVAGEEIGNAGSQARFVFNDQDSHGTAILA
jgi:hypothetical protein